MRKFIFGVVFGVFILPLLDSSCEYISTWIEALKIPPSLKLLNYNRATQEEPEDTGGGCAIGFQIPSEPEYDFE